MGASPLQPPASSGALWSHLATAPPESEAGVGGSTAPPAPAPETSPPRAKTLQKTRSQLAARAYRAAPGAGRSGAEVNKQRGVGNLESREVEGKGQKKKRNAPHPQADPSTSPSPVEGVRRKAAASPG